MIVVIWYRIKVSNSKWTFLKRIPLTSGTPTDSADVVTPQVSPTRTHSNFIYHSISVSPCSGLLYNVWVLDVQRSFPFPTLFLCPSRPQRSSFVMQNAAFHCPWLVHAYRVLQLACVVSYNLTELYLALPVVFSAVLLGFLVPSKLHSGKNSNIQ